MKTSGGNMKLPVELTDTLTAMFADATESQIKRATLLVQSASVRDEVKEAITGLLIPAQEEQPMELADMLTTPGMQEYIDTKVADAQSELQGKLTAAEEAKTAADNQAVEMLQDTIVLMATALRSEGIDPLDLAESQKTYKATLADKSAEELQTLFTDLKKEINDLGKAPSETVDSDLHQTDEPGKNKKADDGEEPDSAPEPVQVNNLGDVFKVVLDNVKADEKPEA
jgi:hypothetical protein